MRLHQILTEMFVRHREKGAEYSWLIAHRENIWVLDRYGDEETPEEVLADIRARTGLQSDDLDDMIEEIESGRNDVLQGSIHGGYLEIDGIDSTNHHPTSSPLVRKVAQTLRLRGVRVRSLGRDGDDEYKSYARKKITGDLPEIFYHGTNLRYIGDILRYGLMPTKNSNWKEVGKFTDRIFLAGQLHTAAFHAHLQARKLTTIPIVIATRLPDPSKIDIDYDVAKQFLGHHPDAHRSGYTGVDRYDDHSRAADVQQYSAGTDHTRSTAVISYLGRIPAINFTGVTVWWDEQPRTYKSVASFVKDMDRRQDQGEWYMDFRRKYDTDWL